MRCKDIMDFEKIDFLPTKRFERFHTPAEMFFDVEDLQSIPL